MSRTFSYLNFLKLHNHWVRALDYFNFYFIAVFGRDIRDITNPPYVMLSVTLCVYLHLCRMNHRWETCTDYSCHVLIAGKHVVPSMLYRMDNKREYVHFMRCHTNHEARVSTYGSQFAFKSYGLFVQEMNPWTRFAHRYNLEEKFGHVTLFSCPCGGQYDNMYATTGQVLRNEFSDQ